MADNENSTLEKIVFTNYKKEVLWKSLNQSKAGWYSLKGKSSCFTICMGILLVCHFELIQFSNRFFQNLQGVHSVYFFIAVHVGNFVINHIQRGFVYRMA